MTRRDFELIAEAVRAAGEDDYVGESEGFEFGRAVVANRLADMCRAQNPRFNRAAFLKACGVDA